MVVWYFRDKIMRLYYYIIVDVECLVGDVCCCWVYGEEFY